MVLLFGGRGGVMKIRSHKDLDVFKMAFDASMKIYELSKAFPKSGRYSLTDQIRPFFEVSLFELGGDFS